MAEVNRRQFLNRTANAIAGLSLGAAGMPFVQCGSSATRFSKSKQRPNIVFFLSDDHAVPAISCYGSRIARTPNIDRIANTGLRFTNCFCTESICAPSRTAILTGKYGHITGGIGWEHYDRSHRTFPEYLQNAGYQTALMGKYHLGDEPLGFDTYNILPGQGRYYDPELISKDGKKVYSGYESDVITDLALAWLGEREPGRPFLLCLHDKATHMPWQPPDRYARLLENEDVLEPEFLFDDHEGRSDAVTHADLTMEGLMLWQEKIWGAPPSELGANEKRRWLYQQYIKHYIRTATAMDENIGRVLDYLGAHGLEKNTIVIYASDQGFFLGEHGWFDKRWMYEESLRLPFLIRYPGITEAGAVCDAMVMNIDFAPTLLNLAGMPIPADMQGRSLLPLLKGEDAPEWRKSLFYRHYTGEFGIPPQYGVRTERYKLIHFYGRTKLYRRDESEWPFVDVWELYDLQNDPHERKNLYESPQHQTIVLELKKELTRLRRELKEPDAEPLLF